MNITIITMGRTNIAQGKYYNLQDAGLAKALAKRGHSVKLYNFVDGESDCVTDLAPNVTVYYIHAKAIGTHTIHSFNFISDAADAVICYSDNQMFYRRVVRICRKMNVTLIPYIGVLGSHNRNYFLSKMIDLVIPNNRIYRRQRVFAKTPAVKQQMEVLGIKGGTIIPACLDEDNMRSDYKHNDRMTVREQLGIPKNAKVILYIGRMIEEKHPEEMLQILKNVYDRDKEAFLVMIGKGVLLEKVQKSRIDMGLEPCSVILPQVPNSEIWNYFYAADAFVNLNRNEIFGMALLEAMYYECPVVAWKAPGPDYIFENEIDGYICSTEKEIIGRIDQILEQRPTELVKRAKSKVDTQFMWKAAAEKIENSIMEMKEWTK